MLACPLTEASRVGEIVATWVTCLCGVFTAHQCVAPPAFSVIAT